MRNKIVVIGCGRLGAAIASESSVKGGNVIIVDKEPRHFERLSEMFSGYKVADDAADIATLESLNLKTVNEVFIATGDDNTNLFIAQVCDKIYQVPTIYARFDDPDKGSLIKGSRIKPIYPFKLAHEKYLDLKLEALKK